jgi:DNA-binding LytR/AlgR family response regulator
MSTKIKCVLLDDEIPGLTYLKMLCQQIPELEVVKAYNDPQKLVHESANVDFDLCILDIEMPKLNGVQVASILKNKSVIFATAHREYAADAFDLDAVDFVQKPVTKERLLVAIKKVLARRPQEKENKEYIQLNTDRGKTIIRINDIAYVTTSEVDGRDKVAVMKDISSVVLKNISFESLQSQLPTHTFCRVNKSSLISLQIIASYTFESITTTLSSDGKTLVFALNEVYRDQFQNATKLFS